MTEHSTTSDAQPPSSPETASVLAGLPRHRAGRRTDRRESARAGAKRGDGTRTDAGPAGTSAAPGGKTPRSTSGKGSTASKRSSRARANTRKKSAGRTGGASAARLPLPPQGFETEDAARVGKTVEPPSRLELATSFVELAGEGVEELVRAGLSAGGSLIKRSLDLIPKP